MHSLHPAPLICSSLSHFRSNWKMYVLRRNKGFSVKYHWARNTELLFSAVTNVKNMGNILQSSFKTCFIIPVNLFNPVTFKARLKLHFLAGAATTFFHEGKSTNIHPDKRKRDEIKSWFCLYSRNKKKRMAFGWSWKLVQMLKAAHSTLIEVILWYIGRVRQLFLVTMKMKNTTLFSQLKIFYHHLNHWTRWQSVDCIYWNNGCSIFF